MPEGPEVRISTLFVNSVCSERLFRGNPVKSSVSKCGEIPFSSPGYTITAESRGKEMALILSCQTDLDNRVRILFRFGMTGRFRFGLEDEEKKHVHLIFRAADDAKLSLRFVDPRRFGSWRVSDEWGKDRGPDPMYEYELFRSNVLDNVQLPVFTKPICEVMLNQKYFNGIGNYLRAEVLLRARTAPFLEARSVLSQLISSSSVEPPAKVPANKERRSCSQSQQLKDKFMQQPSAGPDILTLCRDVPLEVVQLKIGMGKTVDCAVTEEDYCKFMSWLRCYENPDMNNMVDHNGRTIWFKGEAGPLAPKVKKHRKVPKRRKPAGYVETGLKEELPKECIASAVPVRRSKRKREEHKAD